MIRVEGWPRGADGWVRVTAELDEEQAWWLEALAAAWDRRRTVARWLTVTGEVYRTLAAGPKAIEDEVRRALRDALVEARLYPVSPLPVRWQHRELRFDRADDDEGWLPGSPVGVQEGRCVVSCVAVPAPEAGPPAGW